jgi:hypothetical protein
LRVLHSFHERRQTAQHYRTRVADADLS